MHKSIKSDVILSIVTVVKNDPLRLLHTLDSLQGFYEKNQIEHIIVDGGSSDETLSIINKVSIHQNVKIYTGEDKGIYDAMNKGISLSAGIYLLFLNCGDQMLANVSQVLSLLSVPRDAEIICFPCQLNDGKKKYNLSPNLDVKHKTPTSHQAMIFSKSFMKKNFYNINYRVAADYDIYLCANSQRVYSSSCATPITSIQLVGYSSDNPILAYREYLLIAFKRLGGYCRIVTLFRISLKAFVVICIKLIFPRKQFYLVRNFFR